MATLERIRSRAGLIVGVIGLALFAFIIGDFLNSGQTFFRQSKDKVVVVNGKSFSSNEFQSRIEELTTVYKMETGQSTLPEEYVSNIRESVYESLVRETLINEHATAVGLSVSSEEMFDMIQGEHISPMIQRLRIFANPQTGMFDKAALLNFLKVINDDNKDKYKGEQAEQIQELKKYWAYWQKTIKQQRLEEKYSMLLAKSVAPNTLEAKNAFEGGKKSVDFLYAMKPYFSIPDSSIQVTESELKALYDKRKESFKQDETRAVKYIAVKVAPSKDDFKEVETKINAVKQEFSTTTSVSDVVNENSDVQYVDAFMPVRTLPENVKAFVNGGSDGQVMGPYLNGNSYMMHRIVAKSVSPDSVKARHILLQITDEAKTNQLADSIMNVLKNGGDFNALSAKFSIAQNARQGGDFGWFNEEIAVKSMGAEFKDACFSTPVNGYTKVKTMYGIDVIQVTEKTAAIQKVKLASIINEVIPSKKTTGSLYGKLSQYIINNNSSSAFAENAPKSGYVVLDNKVVGQNDYNLGEVRNARQIVHWIFQASKGDVSNIFEVGSYLVAAAVDGIVKKGYSPLEVVKDRLKAEILADKKGDKIIADLKAKNINSLAGYAQAFGSRLDTAKFVSFNTARITGIGDEPALCGIAPYTAKGKLTGPIKGKSGVYVITVTNETVGNQKFDAKAEIKNLQGNYMYRLMYQMMETLKKGADIEDNRIRFY
ncbi:peptidylprolyl isomerase [Parabacteroides sp. FAFU027]|uniref:peptidylprolyl isomerase n=1 Tax=Parabacteroides sp. FAFU027 TaxID=2922715 RepID=UPI001FAFA37B|nr:peptidylprolyl isomerase [Parabacteroides sp. FAFU027]